jgi:hypothetical protein
MLFVAPVAAIAAWGAVWIALHAGGGGRGSAHTLWQSVALAETAVALLMRGRKPIGALAGILAAYLLFDLDPLTLPPMLLALLTVAMIRDRRAVAIATAAAVVVIAAKPYVHGDAVVPWSSLAQLAAAGAAASAGLYLRRARRWRLPSAGPQAF